MALQKGTENVSWGFRNPSNGWHTAVFQEGANLKVNEVSGKESLFLPLMIDEGSEDDGCKVAAFINTRDENRALYKNVDKNIADVVTNAGLYDAFAAKFKDLDTWLDQRVIEALKLKLLGQFVMIETKMAKDQNGNDRCQIIGWAPKGTAKEKKAAGKTADKKATAATTVSTEW
jgi:hypothetical protein